MTFCKTHQLTSSYGVCPKCQTSLRDTDKFQYHEEEIKLSKADKQYLVYQSKVFYSILFEHLATIEAGVCWLLAKHEHFRNCDKCLLHGYFKEVSVKLEDPHTWPNAGAILRARRKVQNTFKLWLPTDPEVRHKRRISEEAYRLYARWPKL